MRARWDQGLACERASPPAGQGGQRARAGAWRRGAPRDEAPRRSTRFHHGVLLLASTASTAIAAVKIIQMKVKYRASISMIFSPKGSRARASRLMRRLRAGHNSS